MASHKSFPDSSSLVVHIGLSQRKLSPIIAFSQIGQRLVLLTGMIAPSAKGSSPDSGGVHTKLGLDGLKLLLLMGLGLQQGLLHSISCQPLLSPPGKPPIHLHHTTCCIAPITFCLFTCPLPPNLSSCLSSLALCNCLAAIYLCPQKASKAVSWSTHMGWSARASAKASSCTRPDIEMQVLH